jgi:hypothetical protein
VTRIAIMTYVIGFVAKRTAAFLLSVIATLTFRSHAAFDDALLAVQTNLGGSAPLHAFFLLFGMSGYAGVGWKRANLGHTYGQILVSLMANF